MAESARDVAARWKRGLVASVPKIKEKVQAMTVSPAVKAIAAKDAYVAGIMQSLEDGTWEKGLREMDFEAWKKKTIDAGTTRIATGAEAATPKMEAFLSQLLPYTEDVKRKIEAMPSSTYEERVARMVANANLMRQFKPRK